MDFDGAIKSHSEWKLKLQSYLRKPDKSLDPNVISQDNQCALGKWIYGEGAAHANSPEFATLKAEHIKFHKAAAEVIRKADTGQNVSEDIAIGGNSEFSKASMSVVSSLMAMKKKA